MGVTVAAAVISMAALHADESLSLGSAQQDSGVLIKSIGKRKPSKQQAISAYVNMVVHDDGETAWKIAVPSIASQARFAAMHGKPIGPVSQATSDILEKIRSYNMKKHGQLGNDFITINFAHEFESMGHRLTVSSTR